MPKVLSGAEVDAYRRNGYHFPVDALSADEVAGFRRQLEDYETASGGPIQGEMRHRSHVLFSWIDEMIRHPKILDAVEDLLGPDILCWNTSFFIKEARDPGFVSWHQDATYWGLSSSDVATAWVAMSPANKVSGCMKFVAGTHLKQVEHEDTFDKNNLLTRGQEIAVEVDEAQAVHVELKPGQASLHHVLLFHGSEPNRSDQRRIGLAIRYIPTHLKQVDHADTFDKNNLLTRGQEIAVTVNETQAVHVELKPGQASLHHVLLFHGSEPNRSDERRIGLAIRYIPTHLKQAVGARDWATLVRGKDTHRNFEPAHVPRRDLEPAALEFHRMVSEEQVRVLYRGTGKTAYRA